MVGRKFRRAFACASLIAVAAASTPATAQQIDRIVVFGDSYTDTGNAFALGYANPQAQLIYSTGRFSGGTNYIDTLSNLTGAPVENFSIGGAFGGTNSGTLCFDATYGAPLCGKGLQYEVDQFLDVGTQSPVFPTASTTLTQSDLLAVSIGGNDARIYQTLNPTSTLADAATAGTAAAAGTAVQLDRIVAQGDPTISFLELNGAVAPEVANDPAAQAIRGSFATAYFSALQPTLAGYAANGSIVHYLNGTLLLQQIAADPSAYGITNGLVCPIFPDPTCIVNSNGYLFYGDALHLTSQGFAIVARYVAAQLAAPPTLGAPADLGVATAKEFGRTLSTRSDLYGRGTVQPGLKLYAVGDYFTDDRGETDQNAAYTITSGGGTLGAEMGLASGVVGVAANYSRPRLTFGNDSSRLKARTWQIGAYGSFSAANLFAQGYGGYGRDKNRLTRSGVVEAMSARPDGSHVLAGAKAGYLMPLTSVRVGPVVALDYAKAKADGYTETGDPVLTLNVERQSLKSLTGQLGVEMRADVAGLRPYAALVAEHEFSGDARVIHFAQTDAPTIVNAWQLNQDKQTYARASLGAAAALPGRASVDAAVTATMGRNGGQEVGGHVGLRMSF